MRIKPKERAIVVGVGLKSEPYTEIKESLAELEELVYSAGAEVVGSVVQVLPQFNPASLIGSGKVQEIKLLAEESQANLIVVDHHLSGVQGRNLESEIGVSVIDRTQLILDIFAQRACTYEGKLQVELALLLDQLPRMVGAWLGSLSRQGGGIGTRGPGETALEMDRRRIRERVKQIRKALEGVRQSRSQHRALRRKQRIPSFALIGYTNAGKSTLLNKLTQSNVLAIDQLFATLDPTTRKIYLQDNMHAVITDTVGFIRKLPAHLIEAFKATLEESGEADVLIHVMDLSSPQLDQQMNEVDKLIREFGWDKKPILHVYNKIDLAPREKQLFAQAFPRVLLSAKTGDGIDRLRKLMIDAVLAAQESVELYFPKSEEHRIYELGRDSQITKTEPSTQGTICYVSMTPSQISRWRQYLVR